MPLVIKELHIKITINQPAQGQQATAASTVQESIAGANETIVSPNEGDKEGEPDNNLTT